MQDTDYDVLQPLGHVTGELELPQESEHNSMLTNMESQPDPEVLQSPVGSLCSSPAANTAASSSSADSPIAVVSSRST